MAIVFILPVNSTSIITQLQAAASASLLKDLLVAAAEGRLHEVQSLLDGGRCKVNDEDEVCTSRGSCAPCISCALRVVCGLPEFHGCKYLCRVPSTVCMRGGGGGW